MRNLLALIRFVRDARQLPAHLRNLEQINEQLAELAAPRRAGNNETNARKPLK